MRRLHINRSRSCYNPDCKSIFSPVNPHANCCCEICRNRINYLYRKAVKNGISKENSKLKYNYVILHCYCDQRKTLATEDELIDSGFSFLVLPTPVGDTPNEKPNKFLVGNFELVALENKKFKIIQK